MQFVRERKGGQGKIKGKEAESRNQKKKQNSRTGVDRRLILGQSSWRHSQMRAHQPRRRNAHLGRSSSSVVLSRRGWSWGCVCGHARRQFLEGGELRRVARGMARDRAGDRGLSRPGKGRTRTASSGGRGIDSGARKRERHHAREASHFLFPQLPVHGLGRPPGDGHFLRDLGPHLCFESEMQGRR